MTFTFRVYYEDDCQYNYKERSKLVRANSKEQAMKRFKEKYGINPLYAV